MMMMKMMTMIMKMMMKMIIDNNHNNYDNLFVAVRLVHAHVTCGWDVNARDKLNCSLLHAAARAGCQRTVALLIECKVWRVMCSA